jgi:hypothetical protein
MCGAYDFIETPAITVSIFPLTVFIGDYAMTTGKGALDFFEKA